ncbi:SMI1/KNR4 family protein [Chryseolinea lacunae]|uniref:Knr4/Smi1-like domain-containing protein n=1 Tax=Chryseolinea lacunae TaxID=2801331 RepID=A0ABS1KPW2_9BACT|nr:SMI1/KNR4 family protein [Chryseolinea lacunae]MBL0741461.1 hypothetical protein [Chryseolinea lacunae]
MNSQLKKSLDGFVERAKGTTAEGETVDRETLKALNERLDGILPFWFLELLATYPLVNAEFNFPLHAPDEDYDGCIQVQWARPAEIFSETVECYPGLAMKPLGYFCFGIDPSGGGNPFFIKNDGSDNPPVFQIYHDVSDDGEVIEREGMEKLADSLSDFLDKTRT